MSYEAMTALVREMQGKSVSLDDNPTAQMIQEWAERLKAALQVIAAPHSPDALKWDFERMMGQRDMVVAELNNARKQIDALVTTQKEQRDDYISAA